MTQLAVYFVIYVVASLAIIMALGSMVKDRSKQESRWFFEAMRAQRGEKKWRDRYTTLYNERLKERTQHGEVHLPTRTDLRE